MSGAHLCEVSSYGRHPVMGSVHMRCSVMSSAQLCEVPSYGRCPVMGSVQIMECVKL